MPRHTGVTLIRKDSPIDHHFISLLIDLIEASKSHNTICCCCRGLGSYYGPTVWRDIDSALQAMRDGGTGDIEGFHYDRNTKTTTVAEGYCFFKLSIETEELSIED